VPSPIPYDFLPAVSSYAGSSFGSLNRSPRTIIAQAIRAILLASATAATLIGRARPHGEAAAAGVSTQPPYGTLMPQSGRRPQHQKRRLCVAKLLAALRKSNYRIRLSAVLNRCCAPVLVFESILLNLVVKIVLQHNPPKADIASLPRYVRSVPKAPGRLARAGGPGPDSPKSGRNLTRSRKGCSA
jgi:hypothetical protein